MPDRRVIARMVGPVVTALLVGTALGWAARVVLEPATTLEPAPDYAVVDVTSGSVGRSVELAVTATWDTVAPLPVRSAGVITAVPIAPGELVDAGDVLLTVDARPVVAAAGAVPAYRDLARGDRGADVAQLERLLHARGLLDDEPDDMFDASTRNAVRRWQAATGVPADGVVRASDVVFVPTLPARLQPADDVVPGATVSPGQFAFDVLASAPHLTIPLQDEQTGLVRAGMSVRVDVGDGVTWSAIVDRVQTPPGGSATATLVGTDGSAVCTTDCALVPARGATALPGRVDVVPAVQGPVVPAAAVSTDARGATFVTDAAGNRVPVTVLATAGGLSAVSGVRPGSTVRLPPEG